MKYVLKYVRPGEYLEPGTIIILPARRLTLKEINNPIESGNSFIVGEITLRKAQVVGEDSQWNYVVEHFDTSALSVVLRDSGRFVYKPLRVHNDTELRYIPKSAVGRYIYYAPADCVYKIVKFYGSMDCFSVRRPRGASFLLENEPHNFVLLPKSFEPKAII